jgi:hypothetical protein
MEAAHATVQQFHIVGYPPPLEGANYAYPYPFIAHQQVSYAKDQNISGPASCRHLRTRISSRRASTSNARGPLEKP